MSKAKPTLTSIKGNTDKNQASVGKTSNKRAPKAGQMQRTRNAILDAAIELLCEVSYGSMTIDLISERSGVARSTIYRYWKSLPQLISEAFDRVIGPMPDLPEEGDLRSRLLSLYLTVPENLGESLWGKILPSLISANSNDPEFAGRLHSIADKRRVKLRELLADAIRDGEIKPETNIEWVIDALSGPFYLRHLITGTSINEPGHIRWSLEMVLNMILTDDKK